MGLILVPVFAIVMMILFFAFFNPFRFQKRQEKRISEAQQGMSSNHFVLHHLKSNAYLLIFGMLFWAAVVIFLLSGYIDWLLLLILPFALIYRIIQGVHFLVWKLEVAGSQMHLRTLFRRREFSFHDISGVKLQTYKLYGFLDTGSERRIIVSFTSGKRISIDTGIVGYQLFIERLRARNIPGIEKFEKVDESGEECLEEAIQEAKKSLSKHGISKKGILLYLAQFFLIFVAAAPMILMFFFDGWVFSDVVTTAELLAAYLFWFQIAGLGGAAICLILMIVGNLLIILAGRKTGHGIKGYLAFGAFTTLLIGMICALLIVEISPDIQMVQRDINAIEQGQLETRRINLSVDIEIGHLWPFLGAESRTVYRLALVRGEPEVLYFPLSLSPNMLREQFRGEQYQFFGFSDYIRVLEIQYTPHLHLVVDATAIATVTLEQADVLVGTWDSDISDFVYVFYADGTGTRGFPDEITSFIWQTQGQSHLQIVINGILEDWIFIVEDETLHLDDRLTFYRR